MKSHDRKLKQNNSGGLAAGLLKLVMLPVRILQPFVTYLIPILVLLLCLPILMVFSGAAGWIVWRNVPVGWQADVFLQYGEASTPFANVPLPPMLADQPYDISLHLVLPATESNYALGNFMATLKLTTAYNDSIITVRRPAALVPRPSSLTKQLLLSPSATVKLEIPLLSQFVSGVSSVNAWLELGRSDNWRGIGNGQGRELSVVEAVLKGRVRPRGLSAVLARYPRLTTFTSTFIFFFVSLLVVSFVLFIAVRSDSSTHTPSQKGSSGSEDYGDDDFRRAGEDEKRYARREPEDRSSKSGSIGPEDDKPRVSDTGGGLRKRRSSPFLETARIKIEDMPTGQRTPPSVYPRSPYPRPNSTGGDSSSRKRNSAIDPVSPSDADAESP